MRHEEGLSKRFLCLPAVHQPALMVEGGWGNFSFYHSYAWAAANVCTQKVTTEHIAAEKQRRKRDACAYMNGCHSAFLFFILYSSCLHYPSTPLKPYVGAFTAAVKK